VIGKTDWLMMVFIAMTVAVFSWAVIPVNIVYVADSLYYVSSAGSLGAGEGYRTPILAGNPANGMYPPLQSAYLSLAWRLNPDFPENQQLIKAMMIALWSLTTTILFATLRKGGSSRLISTLVALAVGTCGGWIYFVAHAFSDVLFSFLALALAFLWIRPDDPTANRLFFRITASGVLLALMYLTRIATFGFIPGAFLAASICSWRRKSWRPVLLLGVPVLAAIIYWSLAPKETFGYGPYATREMALYGGALGWLRHTAGVCAIQSIDYLNANYLVQGELPFSVRGAHRNTGFCRREWRPIPSRF
jgi:hypothetical protein